MADVLIRPARPNDPVALYLGLRGADYDEVAAASGNVYAAIEDAVRISFMCHAAEADGELLALFGVAPVSFISGEGSPWLLGTTHLDRHRGHLMRESRRYLPAMLELFPQLRNFVDARNVKSIRYLKALGFKMHAPLPYGVAGLPFVPFSMDTRNV